MRKYLTKIRGYIVLSVLFYLLETLVTSAMLLFPGYLIDNFEKNSQTIKYLIIAYIVLFMLYILICYISNRLADKRRVAFEGYIKKDFFNAVISKEYTQFQEFQISEYISMQGNDITEMCQNYLGPMTSIYRSVIMIIVFGVSLVVFVDITIALVIIACSMLVVFVPNITSKELAKRNHEYFKSVGQYTTKITNLFQSFTILDKQSKKAVIHEHEKEINDVLNKNMHFRKVNSLALVLNGGSVEFVNVVAFVLVAVFLLNGKITVGMALTVFMYSSKFMEPIHELNLSIGRIRSVEKIKEKLVLIMSKETQTRNIPIEQVIDIKTSNFYKKFDNNHVKIEDMKFNANEKYLLVGDNGAGKSVLLRTMMNFNVLDSGEILINDRDIKGFHVGDVITYSPQNGFVFDATYHDNITVFGTYSDAMLHVYEEYFPIAIIEKLKNSKSLINCSGGEKQVLCLLRCLCMNKPILLLDEPFSAMNAATINTFMQNLNKIDAMVLLIAHNLDGYYDYFTEVRYIGNKSTN